MPDGNRYSRTLSTRMDAEAWLVAERGLIDRDEWTPPQVRRAAEEKRQREAAFNTVEGFANATSPSDRFGRDLPSPATPSETR